MLVQSSRPAQHILTYAQSWRGGGVERAQLRLAREWVAMGRRVTLIIGDPDGPLESERPDGLETVILGSGRFSKLLASVPPLVAQLQPDLIFCPGNHYTSVAAWTRLRLGVECPPTVAKVSNALARPDQHFPVAQGYRAWLRMHPWFVAHAVAMTPAMAIETGQAMALGADRISVIANPPAQSIPGAVLPDLPDGRFLLGVGRLVPQKRWDRLIAAMPRLADANVCLVIFGDGGERARLEALIAALGLQQRVLLPGHVIDPLPAIERAAAVALVSDFEGVPGVLREALAHGTPVVTTDSTVATPEIVTTPGHGTIVASGDEDALVAALDHWLAPGRLRPQPVPQPGEHAALDYLALFDSLAARRVR